jgi:hypothetical protein
MTEKCRNWSRFLGSGYLLAGASASGCGCACASSAPVLRRYLLAAICIALFGTPASSPTSTCSTSGVFSGKPQCAACRLARCGIAVHARRNVLYTKTCGRGELRGLRGTNRKRCSQT